MIKLTLIDKAFFLKRSPLFETLDLDILLAIADKLNIVTFEANDSIFGINDDALRMYFVVKGTIELKDENNNLVAFLNNEDFFGEEALFSEKSRAYSAVSKTDSTLLALSRTNLLNIISECPAVAIGFLQAYTLPTGIRPRKT
jgi:CRP/FNR family transcriptional regulator, cyclic AMP receptor protein